MKSQLSPKQRLVLRRMLEGEELRRYFPLRSGPARVAFVGWPTNLTRTAESLEERGLIRRPGARMGATHVDYELTDAGRQAIA